MALLMTRALDGEVVKYLEPRNDIPQRHLRQDSKILPSQKEVCITLSVRILQFVV
jgi:hypothetical protein